MITLNQIRNFLVLAQELHFGKAAEKLGISQAALSGEIRKLERETDCCLFDRSDKWNIRLTASGSAYFKHMRELPDIIEGAKTAAGKAARGETGTLSIAVNPSVYDHLNLSELFRRMAQKYPAVRMNICDCFSSQGVEFLHEGMSDIGFITHISQMDQYRDFRFRELFHTRFCFAIPKDHRLAGRKKLSFADVQNCRFILPPLTGTPGLRQKLDQYFIRFGHFQPRVSQEARGLSATLHLVAAGLGIGILPEDYSRRFPDFIAFRPLPVQLERVVIAAWLESNISPALLRFLELLGDGAFLNRTPAAPEA